MRRVTVCVCLFVVLATIGPVHGESTPSVRISEIHPRPVPDGREFIELWNPGDAVIGLTDWTITDSTNGSNRFTFDETSLPPGARIVVWGGGNESALGPIWKANVWNNGGDTVWLRDASGALVDTMEYGTTDVPAPDEGVSLHWVDGWVASGPTPGQDMQAQDGSATATVSDLPPEVAWSDPPASARPGQEVAVTFSVHDPNGDPVAWTVDAGGQNVHNGTGDGLHTVQVTAPTTSGPWTWVLTATSTDQQVEASLDIQVRNGTLRVVLPDDGIRLVGLVPGAIDVEADAPFQVVNDGEGSVVPYLDMSPFRAAGGAIPVDGNLGLRIDRPDGTTETVDYAGPLHALPSLGPYGSMRITLVLHEVPSPLPAGDYRSTFTVVA